jgi:hypothetical protein
MLNAAAQGHEVGRVGAWHEVKAQAVEVARMVQELTGQVRDWLDRAAERVLDRLGPGQSELALAGGREGREKEPDLATRLRAAWEARQSRPEVQETATPEREAPQDLAARLREAATGIDHDALADRAAELREGREAEERQAELDAAHERELVRQQEIEREVDSIAERDRGRGHSL